METSLSRGAHSAKPSQQKRLEERKSAAPMPVTVCGVDFIVERGVYGTSVDTELMAETVRLNPQETFLEIGCGSGAVSILLAKKCQRGMGTDINALAVQNARCNAERLGVRNVIFMEGDGFAGITEKFSVLICNPPYNNSPVQDSIDRMFWDPNDELKTSFFQGAASHLLPGGRIYFGWANFADIDVELPLRLAKKHHFQLVNTTERLSHSRKYVFYVFEFGG